MTPTCVVINVDNEDILGRLLIWVIEEEHHIFDLVANVMVKRAKDVYRVVERWIMLEFHQILGAMRGIVWLLILNDNKSLHTSIYINWFLVLRNTTDFSGEDRFEKERKDFQMTDLCMIETISLISLGSGCCCCCCCGCE